MNAAFGSVAIGDDPRDEAVGHDGRVDAREADVGAGGVGVLRDEQPAEARRGPQRAGIERRSLGRDDDAAGAIAAVARRSSGRRPAAGGVRRRSGRERETRRRAAPSRRRSPAADPPVNRQLASSAAWLPPLFFVRQTCWKPVNCVSGLTSSNERNCRPVDAVIVARSSAARIGSSMRTQRARSPLREIDEEAVALEAGEHHARARADGTPTPTCRRRTGTRSSTRRAAPVPSSQIVPLSCSPPIIRCSGARGSTRRRCRTAASAGRD